MLGVPSLRLSPEHQKAAHTAVVVVVTVVAPGVELDMKVAIASGVVLGMKAVVVGVVGVVATAAGLGEEGSSFDC